MLTSLCVWHRLDMLSSTKALKIGAVISRPGARVQRFHCDATHAMFAAAQADPLHRIYDVFIPLVDLCQDGDGTPHMQVDVREVGEGESVGVGEAERNKKRAGWERLEATPLSDA